MIKKDKVLVCDIDGTVTTIKNKDENYSDLRPIQSVVDKLIQLRSEGWYIVFSTARNMRTYNGDVRAIEENMLPILIDWLDKHNIPYDEIHIGKPWCGKRGFYVDDKTIRPKEFLELSNQEIHKLLEKDRLNP
jgi:capsule biosynthesis phosphatase